MVIRQSYHRLSEMGYSLSAFAPTQGDSGHDLRQAASTGHLWARWLAEVNTEVNAKLGASIH